MTTLKDYDSWISAEIKAFDKSANFAQKKGLLRFSIHAASCRDALLMARAVFRTSLFPEAVESGEVIMAFVAQKMSKKVEKK